MSRRPASDGLPRITRRIEVRLSPPFGGEDFPDMPMSACLQKSRLARQPKPGGPWQNSINQIKRELL
jgi:hypothetical protein